MQPDHPPEPWHSFLQQLDAALPEPIELDCQRRNLARPARWVSAIRWRAAADMVRFGTSNPRPGPPLTSEKAWMARSRRPASARA